MSGPVPDVSHLVLAHYIKPVEDSDETRFEPRRVFLDWWVTRPFTVLCTFQNHPVAQEWLMSRELLATGLYVPAGVGDVQLFPAMDRPGCVELVLSNPYGRLGVLFARLALHRFLAETFGLVPAGAEVLPESWFEELIGS